MKTRHRKSGAAVDLTDMGAAKHDLPDLETTYTCRICFEESRDASQLISPCLCKGESRVLKRHRKLVGLGVSPVLASHQVGMVQERVM